MSAQIKRVIIVIGALNMLSTSSSISRFYAGETFNSSTVNLIAKAIHLGSERNAPCHSH